MNDKQAECGCHEDCTGGDGCPHPCVWPNCLTEQEHIQLGHEVTDMLKGVYPLPCGCSPDYIENDEVASDYHDRVCLSQTRH